jgi:hypothetical protein
VVEDLSELAELAKNERLLPAIRARMAAVADP